MWAVLLLFPINLHRICLTKPGGAWAPWWILLIDRIWVLERGIMTTFYDLLMAWNLQIPGSWVFSYMSHHSSIIPSTNCLPFSMFNIWCSWDTSLWLHLRFLLFQLLMFNGWLLSVTISCSDYEARKYPLVNLQSLHMFKLLLLLFPCDLGAHRFVPPVRCINSLM
jgi:hypothetical protein